MLDHNNSYYATQVPLPQPTRPYVRRSVTGFGAAFVGTLAAAAIYACVLGAIVLLVAIYESAATNQALGEAFCGLLGSIAVFLVVVFFYLVLAAVPLALLSLTLCLAIARSLYTDVRWSIVGGMGGGLTGYLGTCWILARPSPGDWWWNLSLLLGPVLATLLGQAGGCWAALAPWVMRYFYEAGEQRDTRTALQFGIRQIMIATAWVAGILGALKLLGALGVGSASVLFGGLVVQALTLPLVLRAVKKVRQG